MKNAKHIKANDILGYSRLGLNSFTGIVDLVESMHATIARRASPLNNHIDDNTTSGITGLVYRSIRAIPNVLTGGIDIAMPALTGLDDDSASSEQRETALAVLNGVLGDHLEHSQNPLAITMNFRVDGESLSMHSEQLAAAVPEAGGKILLLVHGLCMNDLQWTRDQHNHGAELARDFGYTPVHLHYNTGRHISHNGREFADKLEQLLAQWPVAVEELVIVAHSMGGLLSRSALHYAAQLNHDWPGSLKKLVFLGTPHHGAPMERGGNVIDAIIDFSPYTAPFNRLGKIRSAGITDLRYGNIVDEDWSSNDRFERAGDQRQVIPLPRGIEYYMMAATKTADTGLLANSLLGDGLVPIDSAHGSHADPDFCLDIPEDNKAVVYEMGHFDLLSQAEVYQQVHAWLAD